MGTISQTAAEEFFRTSGVNELHREVIPKRNPEAPEVLEVQVIPSDEVTMVPELPTATKILFA